MRFKEFLREDSQFFTTLEETEKWLLSSANLHPNGKFVIDDNLIVNCTSHVEILGEAQYREPIEKFPVQFGTIDGDFLAYKIGLTSLKGAPREVDGTFDISENRLTSLEGGPVEVVDHYHADGNDLITLKGSPKEITGNFEIYGNNLTTLKYSPKEIQGNLEASSNPLKDLKDGPKIVHGDVFVKNIFDEEPDHSLIDIKGNLYF